MNPHSQTDDQAPLPGYGDSTIGGGNGGGGTVFGINCRYGDGSGSGINDDDGNGGGSGYQELYGYLNGDGSGKGYGYHNYDSSVASMSTADPDLWVVWDAEQELR